MTRSTKLVLLISAILISMAVPYLLIRKSVNEVDLTPVGNNYVVDFNELNKKVYFHTEAWGLAGNNERIVVSTAPITTERPFNKTQDYIFYTPDVYYQKRGIDTLIIYAGLSTIGPYPKNFRSDVKVIIQELKNYDEVSDYDNNYKKYGLSKVTVYDEKQN